MKTLHVLYDPNCPFCLKCRDWLEAQPAFIPLILIPASSEEAARLFPGLETPGRCGDLTVVSDEGDVYEGPNAFIICLYALEAYREWSLRLARPALLPLARRAFELLSRHRGLLSRWIGTNPSDEELSAEIHATAEEPPSDDRCGLASTAKSARPQSPPTGRQS